MTAQAPVHKGELLEKIRQQFDSAPYPRVPVEESPKDNPDVLHLHGLITPYYLRNQRVVGTKDKVILDAGCGTGYKSLTLALANPGAKIVGVDLSQESIQLAEKRLQYHGVENVEFHTLLLEDLPKLGLEFDYINCDDVLYLLPDAVAGLRAMKSVLASDGIIRVNLHSQLQREWYYRAQKLCKFMGLMDENPEAMELSAVRDIMRALKNDTLLKVKTWNPINEEDDGSILANHLLVGDKGSTIPQFFKLLSDAELEFISMVNWLQWDVMDLFKEPDNLPAFLALSLPDLSNEEKLHLFELFHPVHRLLDLWCGHPQQQQAPKPVTEWEKADWEKAKAYLHPQLKTYKFREDLINCVTELKAFPISNHLSLIKNQFISIDSAMALCLVRLLDQPQPITSLIQTWKQIRSIDPITLKPVEYEQAFQLVEQMLLRLEGLGYIMLERQT
jgi:2-polyprenyl-3-methyl-5-hydroxy-6-metoxy-1,4-benzoquinol methylase